MNECKICGRDSVNKDYCDYHQAAYSNLKSAFENWTEAIEKLTWEEYINMVYNLENTGQWVKEMIEDIMLQDSP